VSARLRLGSVLAVFLTASAAAAAAEVPAELTDPSDSATYAWLLERAEKQPHVERGRDGSVQWIGFEGESKYACSLYLDEQGRVARLMFNKAGFRNDELERLAGFEHVTAIKIAHNFDDAGPNGYRTGPNPMSGAGWKAFAGHRLTSFAVGGCNFDGDGVRAVATFPQVRELSFNHTRVSDADLAALEGHPTLESVSLSPMWGDQVTDAALQRLAEIPNLKSVRMNETYLTYEDGLKHLEKRRDTLREVNLANCVVTPEDLATFQRAMPNVEVKHAPIEEVGKLVATNFKGAYKKLSKRAPAEVVERFKAIGDRALAEQAEK